MFESEVGFKRLSAAELPPPILSKFQETASLVTHRSVIPWAEHCSECSAPACFATCEFYDPRADMKCRRFLGGFFAVAVDSAAVGSVLRLTFRRWGKLEGEGTTAMRTTSDAVAWERRDALIGKAVSRSILPFGAKVYATRARQRQKLATTRKTTSPDQVPNVFVIEAYNPGFEPISATLTIRPTDLNQASRFQHPLRFVSGYNRVLIPHDDIRVRLDLSQPFLVQFEPQETERPTTLYVGLIDFAHVDMPSTTPAAAAPMKAAKAAKAKCVVWDLDNTMWKGTLIEDGSEALMLDPVAVNAVRELDRRGVLNSIASKNNADDALAALERFGLRDYFLHPQISWGPKSQGIAEIARRLNIGIDSLVFIDDQPFERAEVQAAHPAIPVIDAAELESLLAHPRFDVPVTAESQARRSMYRDEISRDQALTQSAGDYLAFLRGCSLTLTVARLTPETVQRTHELAQRTNQMNFSGSRYSVANIEHMLSHDRLDAYVLRASDRFGDYGMIGFAVVDRDEAMLRDLMFSCRIQGKHVDRALLTFLLGRYRSAAPGAPFRAIYRETDKNRPAAQLFWDLGFEKIESDGNRHTLAYDVSRRGLPHQDIVTVVVE